MQINMGTGQHVELKEKSGRLARIFRATKLFREDVSLILMKKVIGVELLHHHPNANRLEKLTTSTPLEETSRYIRKITVAVKNVDPCCRSVRTSC